MLNTVCRYFSGTLFFLGWTFRRSGNLLLCFIILIQGQGTSLLSWTPVRICFSRLNTLDKRSWLLAEFFDDLIFSLHRFHQISNQLLLELFQLLYLRLVLLLANNSLQANLHMLSQSRFVLLQYIVFLFSLGFNSLLNDLLCLLSFINLLHLTRRPLRVHTWTQKLFRLHSNVDS